MSAIMDFGKITVTTSHTGVEGDILAKHEDNDSHLRIGGKGGTDFSDAKYDRGIVVSGLEVWADTSTLRGIRIKFSDNSSVMHGESEGNYCGSISLDYLNGETVTELSIWGNGEGSRCGAFRIKTSKNQEFFPKMTKRELKTEYKMNSGGGVILGVIGASGADIDCLGFLMLDKVKNRVLTEFEYDLNTISLPEKKYAYDVTIPNPSDGDSDKGSVQQRIEKQRGGEWFLKGGVTLGQEYKVKGGVPFLGEGEITSKWQVGFEAGYTQKWSDTTTQTVSVPLIAPALTKTRIVYSYFQGKIDSCPFVATMKYYLQSGGIWNCQVTGFYDGIDTTRVVGNTHPIAKWDKNKNKWIENNNPTAKVI